MSTTSATQRTFKVHVGNEIRRFIVDIGNGPSAYTAFKAKVNEVFTGDDLTFKWKDSDGDLISIANAEDFNETLLEQPTGAVRLFANGAGADTLVPTPVTTTPTPCFEAKSDPAPEPEPKTEQPPPPPPKPEPVTHFHVVCDDSGESPLRGTRYHKMGENYDLNEASFAKLAEPEKQQYEIILYPGADPVPYEPVIHYGVTCDVTNVGPIIGLRFHKIGENYDLTHKCFAELEEEEKLKYELIVHPRKAPIPYKRPAVDDEEVPDLFRLIQNAVTMLPTGTIDVNLSELLQKMHQHKPNANANSSNRCGRGPCRGPCRPSGCGTGRGVGHPDHPKLHQWRRCGRGAYQHHKGIAAGPDNLPVGCFGNGSVGEGVAQLQHFLIKQGLMEEQAIEYGAGHYGRWTSRAIRNFQQTNGIQSDEYGTYNEATRNALLAMAEVNPESVPTSQDNAAPSASVAEAKPDETPVAANVPETPSRYANEIRQLNQMGFEDNELLIELLDQKHGSVPATLTELLQ